MSPYPGGLNTFAIINCINAIFSFLVIFVLSLRRSHRPIHTTYGLWTFFLFSWSFTYFIWGILGKKDQALFWLHATVLAICFLHSTFFHCCTNLAGNNSRHRTAIVASYISSFILGALCVNSVFFDLGNIREISGFAFWPKASPALAILIGIEVLFVLAGLAILIRASHHEPNADGTKQRVFAIASLFAWFFGWTNWFGFYDWPPMLPLANLGVSVYVAMTAYLVVRHDLLDLNIAAQKTIVFMIVTLAISAAFSLTVVLSERISREYFGYGSLFVTVFASMIIALLITPFKEILSDKIAALFFGKGITALSQENADLRVNMISNDRLRSVATLAAGMAHEIKNPLTAIKTFTEYLPAKASDPAFLDKFRRVVGQEVDKIDSIVRQVLEFSRPQAQMTDGVELNSIVDSTLELLNAQMVRAQVVLERQLEPGLPLLRADRKLLQQALLNILINAIEAMPGGGHLRVSTQLRDGSIRILISDTGCGISSAALPRIFDPFYSDKEAGTGLGLSIVKGIMDQHRGKISVRSVVGQGTEFTLSLSISGGAHQHA